MALFFIMALMSIIGYMAYKKGKSEAITKVVYEEVKTTDTIYTSTIIWDTMRLKAKPVIPAKVIVNKEWLSKNEPTLEKLKGTTAGYPRLNLKLSDSLKLPNLNFTNTLPAVVGITSDTLSFLICSADGVTHKEVYYPNLTKFGYIYHNGKLTSYPYKPKRNYSTDDPHNKVFTLSSFAGYNPLHGNFMGSIDGYYLWNNIGPQARVSIEQIPGSKELQVRPYIGLRVDLK